MKHIHKFNEDFNSKMGISGDNMVPDKVIDAFYNRIDKKLKDGYNINGDFIQNELDNIESINGFIPDDIVQLLMSYDN